MKLRSTGVHASRSALKRYFLTRVYNESGPATQPLVQTSLHLIDKTCIAMQYLKVHPNRAVVKGSKKVVIVTSKFRPARFRPHD